MGGIFQLLEFILTPSLTFFQGANQKAGEMEEEEGGVMGL